ncbi:unnamed protein product [Amoebophrya sp. A120]|nr:unnamed protein product [Amoebophrya sp. A120]|eukprot:GSA120T00003105001.1
MRGDTYYRALDPNSVSNLQVINGNLDDKTSYLWTIAKRMKKEALLQEVIDKTHPLKRWMLPYKVSLEYCAGKNGKFKICFIVKVDGRTGKYMMGPGQKTEVRTVHSILQGGGTPPLVLYLKECRKEGGKVRPGKLQEFTGSMAMAANVMKKLVADAQL